MTIEALFVDVGGVLLTNGWDTSLRHELAQRFAIEQDEMNKRHQILFEDLECGKCGLDEYLRYVIFFKERPFTLDQFKEAIFEASKPYPNSIARIREMKKKYQAKLFVVSNEGAELAEYRYKKFNFHEFVDSYIVSGFVGFRKPDLRIYQLALDLSQVQPNKVLYIDDRAQYFEASRSLGIRSAQLKSTN